MQRITGGAQSPSDPGLPGGRAGEANGAAARSPSAAPSLAAAPLPVVRSPGATRALNAAFATHATPAAPVNPGAAGSPRSPGSPLGPPFLAHAGTPSGARMTAPTQPPDAPSRPPGPRAGGAHPSGDAEYVRGSTLRASVFLTRYAHAARNSQRIQDRAREVARLERPIEAVDHGAREDPVFWRALFATPESEALSIASLKEALPACVLADDAALASIAAASPRALHLIEGAERQTRIALQALATRDADPDDAVAPHVRALSTSPIADGLKQALEHTPGLLEPYPPRTRARVVRTFSTEALTALARGRETAMALVSAAPELLRHPAFACISDRRSLLEVVNKNPGALPALTDAERATFFETREVALESLTLCPTLAAALPGPIAADDAFLETAVAHEPKILEHLWDASASNPEAAARKARLLRRAVEGPHLYPRDEAGPKLVCPLTGERFVEPVLARDGYVYSKAALVAKLDENGRRSPLVPHLALDPSTLVPVIALRALAQSEAEAGARLAPEVIQEKLIDPVTLSPLTDPIVDPFGHAFDFATLKKWFEVKPTGARCPSNNETYPADSVFIRCRWMTQMLDEPTLQAPAKRIFRFQTSNT